MNRSRVDLLCEVKRKDGFMCLKGIPHSHEIGNPRDESSWRGKIVNSIWTIFPAPIRELNAVI